MNLNDENIDELMFQLLEGDIKGEERSKLLDAINADKNYSKLWQAWQQTVLNPADELLVMNSDKLKKGSSGKGKVVLLWWKYAVAAAVVMAVALTVYHTNKNKEQEMVNQASPGNPKLQIIKVPSLESTKQQNRTNDSLPSFKQKVQMMADESKNTTRIKELNIENETLYPVHPELNQQPLQSDKIVEVKEPVVILPKIEPEERTVVLPVLKEESGVIMTVYSDNESKKSRPGINQVLQDKKNLLARIFSAPKMKIVNDSNTYTRKKLIIENKEYKIIAGF